MFKFLLIGGILVTPLLFSGCGDSKNNQLVTLKGTYDGTWVSDKSGDKGGQIITVLKNDSGYSVKWEDFQGSEQPVTTLVNLPVTISNNSISFTINDSVWKCVITDTALVSSEGVVYKKRVTSSHLNAVPSANTVKIGNHVWMLMNLNVSVFSNGDSIPEIKDSAEWVKAGEKGKPAWCYYDNDPEHGKKHGKLYNWFAVNDSRGLAPEGWHVPSKDEFDAVITNCGGAGTNAYKSLLPGGSSGFSSLFSGYRYYYGSFFDLGVSANYWSASKYSGYDTWLLLIYGRHQYSCVGGYYRSCGFSVRCVQD